MKYPDILRIYQRVSAHFSNAFSQQSEKTLVGCPILSDLTKKDCLAIKKLKKAANEKRHETYSFEAKPKIYKSKVVPFVLQARENSSWADRQYLVFSHTSKDDTLKLLEENCRKHEMGLIKLNVNDVLKSEILIEAPSNQQPDLNARDELASENSDFADYIDLITDFLLTDRLKETDWDIDLD